MASAPPPLAITDPDDPRLAGYRDVRERDLAGRDGLFIAEGDVVVRVLLAQRRYRLRSILVSERRWPQLAELLAAAPASAADLAEPPKIGVVNQSAMDALVGFPIHRGLLALAERGPDADAGALLDAALAARPDADAAPPPAAAAPPDGALAAPPPVTVVAAIGIANHDNLGGIFRNAAAFGAAAVLLDATSCDPLYRKSIRVSVGGALVVPFARVPSAAALLDLLAERGFEAIALAPRADRQIDELAPGPRRALLLGAEGPGLPAAVLARARAARIDIVPGFDSLNVAVACGIALHALARPHRIPAPPRK